MDCYRTLGGCHRQGGDRKTPPQPSSSQSPGLSYKQVFQDLTPCWSDAGEGLTHFDITPTVGPAPGLPGTKGDLQPWAQDPSHRTNLCVQLGWEHSIGRPLVPILQRSEWAEHSCGNSTGWQDTS